MISIFVDLATGIAVVALIVLLARFCRKRSITPPPTRLPFVAVLLTTLFNILIVGREQLLPSSFMVVESALRAADELIVALAATRIMIWVFLQLPVDLKFFKPVAKIARDLIFLAASTIITIVIFQHYFSINLVSLAATSAVLTAVIGLAAQETLKNLFAGLSLELDCPFEEGDWVSVNGVCGEIKSLRLMTTRLLTVTGEMVVIPNSQLCNEGLKRVRRNKPVAQILTIGLDYSLPPHQAMHALKSVLRKHSKILQEPKPLVRIDHFGESAVIYKIYMWQSSPFERIGLRSEILEHIWYTLQREGHGIPYPIREIIVRNDLEDADHDGTEESTLKLISTLGNLSYFEHFSYDKLEQLVFSSTLHEFGNGETIIEEGSKGESLYILLKGCLQAVKGETTHQRLLDTLHPVSMVGEMSFYTGAARSATVRCIEASTLLEIKRSTLSPLLKEEPALLEEIGTLIERRQQPHDESETIQATDKKKSKIVNLMRQIFLHEEED